MTATVDCVAAVPDPAELRAAVRDYLEGVVPHFRERLGDVFDAGAMAEATLGNLAAYLPPRGRLMVARDADGPLLGTCFLKMLAPDTAEIKRLFVRPAARGMGLGGALARRAVAEARAMGARRVLLDTGVWMSEAQALYRRMGFVEIGRYAESENPPEVENLLVYMELALAPDGVTPVSR